MGWSVPRATKEMIKALPDFDYADDTTQRDKFVDLDFVEEAEKMLLPGKVALRGRRGVGGIGRCRSRSERRYRVSSCAPRNHRHAVRPRHRSFQGRDHVARGGSRSRDWRGQVQTAGANRHCKSGSRACRTAREAARGALRHEAAAKALAIKKQLDHAEGEVKGTLEDWVEPVESACHARKTKLSKAWGLTKEALAV